MTDNVKQAYKFFQKYPGHLKTATDDIADRLNISYEEVAKGRRIYRDDNKQPDQKNKTVSNANEGVNERIDAVQAHESYEEFLEHHGINKEDVTNVWYKEKQSGTYFSVETRKYKDLDPEFDPREAFIQSIKEYQIPDYSAKLHKPNFTAERCAVINLFDAHLDKISSTKDTDEDSTLESNVQVFDEAFDELLESVANKHPEQIVIPLGNDFFHTNNADRTTKKGTDLKEHIETDPMTSFRAGFNLLRRNIDKARTIAPVTLYFIRGNHDSDRVKYLLEMMLVAYENQEDVTVVDSHKSRQYYRYGTWLFGFAHGDKDRKAADLPGLMSTDKDSRKHWAEIKQGIFFLGDIHHEKKYEYMRSQDFRGCKVMFLRASNGAIDEWHWSNGFTAIPKTAYAFIYDADGKRDYEIKVNI